MPDRYLHVLRALVDQPWAVLPSVLETMLAVVERRLVGERLTADELRAAIGEAAPAPRDPVRVGSVAILPLHGVLAQRMNLFTQISGGTSTERFGAQLQETAADRDVAALVIDADTPGGQVFGTEELARQVRQVRQETEKPIVAVVNSLMASAGYWVGCQADEVVIPRGGVVGGFGVYTIHTDVSTADEVGGIVRTPISAGKYKIAGAGGLPLTDEGRAVLQGAVDEAYANFLSAVARGRGVSAQTVRTGYGEGRALYAASALAADLVDRVETLPDVVKRLSSPQGRRAIQTRQAAHGRASVATSQEPRAATDQEPTIAQLDTDRLRLALSILLTR